MLICIRLNLVYFWVWKCGICLYCGQQKGYTKCIFSGVDLKGIKTE